MGPPTSNEGTAVPDTLKISCFQGFFGMFRCPGRLGAVSGRFPAVLGRFRGVFSKIRENLRFLENGRLVAFWEGRGRSWGGPAARAGLNF